MHQEMNKSRHQKGLCTWAS